jgi:RHS repeat-associated protein
MNAPERAAESSRPVGSQNPAETTPLHLRSARRAKKFLQLAIAMIASSWMVVTVPPVAAQTSTDPSLSAPTTDPTLTGNAPVADPNGVDPTTGAPLAPTGEATTGSNIPADYEGPIGVTGIFNGNITTGCSYDPLTHSAKRTIDDIVVPGSIGKYPLKMTRYYNSRLQYASANLGPGWQHEYAWLSTAGGDKIVTPSGAIYDYRCDWPLGVSEHWEPDNNHRPDSTNGYSGTFRLADGGKVVFASARVTDIYDPYGQRTRMTRDPNGFLTRVTEPGGRYLQFFYQESDTVYGATFWLLTRVEAHGLGNATVTDWVNYSYTSVPPGGSGAAWKMLTDVEYSDSTHATYAYRTDNVTENPPTTYKYYPLLSYASDVRYKGPMRQISYIYDVAVFPQSAPHGAILRERNYTTGYDVSKIQPALLSNDNTPPTVFTETRGDGPTRTFTYTNLTLGSNTEGETCPFVLQGPLQQFVLSYTDFQGHTTSLGYDTTTWFVTSVTDANTHKTTYIRGASIGEVRQITHPDNRSIVYTYYTDPHYVLTVTDENGNWTGYTRDPNNNYLVSRIDYRDSTNALLAWETFSYNSFGQVVTHRMKNGAYQHFQYDTRGLLTAKTNPTSIDVPGGAFTWAPKTTYTYYGTGDPVGGNAWVDRVKTETMPANVSGYQASETYEYDRNASNVAVAGRGQVTKITHADNTYRSFDYDNYGNKLWEKNELLQQTTYTYDVYNRLLTATRVMSPNETTIYTYAPTNGTNTSPLVHTTSNPDTVKSPSGILTTNDYDENFRKISVTEPLAPPTTFDYDNVGNPKSVTDPLNHVTFTTYDNRDRKRTVTVGYGTTLAETTTYSYDFGNNVTRIDKPAGFWETKDYDGLNRVTHDMVPQKGGTTPVNLSTWFDYNPSGTIQKVTDPNGHWTSFEYDESDRKTKMTYQSAEDRTWTYDDAGNLASRTTIGGKTQTFGYDTRNQKNTMVWSNSAEWQYFVYDAAGRLTTAKNGTGTWNTNIISTVTRSYDAAGRLILDRQAVTGLATKDVNYDYDLDGKPTRLYVTGAGYDYTFSYDARGRFEKIVPTGATTPYFQYSYDAASNETQRYSSANGVAQIYGRDVLNRMSRRDVKKGLQSLSFEVYTYDDMNRLTDVDREGTSDDHYGYYLNSELYWATYDNGALTNKTYVLDKGGNRTAVSDGGVSKSYTPNAINVYTSADNKAEINGSEQEITGYDGVSYSYINDGQLATAAYGSGSIAYSYDALGRVVKRVLSGTQTYFDIYDGERCIFEYNVNGSPIARYVYGKGIDEILSKLDYIRGWTLYYQQDHEGSVTHITNAAGTVVEKYKYDAFGAPTWYNAAGTQIYSSAYANAMLYTGRVYQNYGYYEYRARAYQPYIGRFMSEDPKLFDAGDYNLFRYCHNDPLDLTDPMGLYAMGDNFTPDQWQKFDVAQKAAAQRLEKTVTRVQDALGAGKDSKEFKSLNKDFRSIFGKDATAESLAKVTQAAKGMITALRDDGSKGYIANGMSAKEMMSNFKGTDRNTMAVGRTPGNVIYVNVDHRSFAKQSALSWAVGHESAHNVGLEHGTLNGVIAYKYGNEQQRAAYRMLPSLAPEQAIQNPDNYMDFAR